MIYTVTFNPALDYIVRGEAVKYRRDQPGGIR